jgi:hypothetical protein
MQKILSKLFLFLWIIPVFCAAVEAQDVSSKTGAKVLSTKYDGQTLTIALQNTSNKEITSLNVKLDLVHKDGKTGSPSVLWDLAGEAIKKKWELSQGILSTNGLDKSSLRPGEVIEHSMPFETWEPGNPIVQVLPRVDAILYADGTTETQNQESLQVLLKGRRQNISRAGPMVVYEDTPASPSAKRQLKNEVFSHTGFPVVTKMVSAGSIPEITLPVPSSSANLPALPLPQSDLVIVGKVIDMKAYLASGGNGIYSEIQIEPEEVLKGDNPDVAKGLAVIAHRPGGVVLFKDGGVQIYKVAQQDWPIFGHEYLFFLKSSQAGDFDLLTAYRLRGGFVSALDDAGNKNSPFHVYHGAKEKDFMSAVKRAIEGGN